MEKMVLLALRRSAPSLQMATASPTWPATSGNGAAIGTGPIITPNFNSLELGWHGIPKAPTAATGAAMTNPSAFNAAAHFSVPTNIVPVT